ncbi:DUF1080 domain-containing protein [Flavivirga aquimarina]|uniref:DUF1080 domain-containing protein n=1 Tax=Flavivirga aquimarina TaxID=2027862 RepID=A0ABT8WGQ5_9FLAO|nr:DUF1080 domain-containing protein [Flavivirga aquimarina]MDO5972347.1 DUF1080 domain-containing protein [Flavivirga aquimarina]
MKYLSFLTTILIIYFTVSCTKDKKLVNTFPEEKKKQIEALPFTALDLTDMNAFKPVSKNWNIVGDVVANRTKKQAFSASEGTGVLLNTPQKETKEHLFTSFEHGDIELEFDVMMPLQSNSGIYFQGRYEIQLFDSWGIENLKHSDIGGIYQRWNNDAEKGKEGYEGHPPKLNAAKAPGLWQHFNILFRAPRFDDAGNKIKNAQFEKVILNGMLLHENIEVFGPTRSSAFNDEKAMGPLMIQGDHGAVAFKNMKYKLYESKAIGIKSTSLKTYDNPNEITVIKTIDSFNKISEIKTDSISPMMRVDRNGRNILTYSGALSIPDSGDYLFEMKVNGGTFLIINNDTIINLNNLFRSDTTAFKKVALKKGDVSYKLLYNKPFPWYRGFDLYVEGPNMQRYSIQKTSLDDLRKQKPIKEITLEVKDQPITQRSFIIHKGEKRTHCISVGLTEHLNYTLDLATGSLLQVWNGAFLRTTQMWHSRGQHQTGEPIGFTIASHGDLDFAYLENKNDEWPKHLNEDLSFKSLGYEFDDKQIPKFSFKINDAEISNILIASKDEKRGLNRIISINSQTPIWHKIAGGSSIKALPNNTYIINNESYYIDFSGNKNLKPLIRHSHGKDELLVKIPKGESTINYDIIW